MAATKTKKKPAEELTLDQVAERNLRTKLTNYREEVTRAADGDHFHGDDLGRVEAMLTDLELPHFAWERDVAALKKHRHLSQQLADVESRRPADLEEAATLTKEIAHIERRLAEARGRLNEVTRVSSNLAVGLSQRLCELESNHPHVLGDVEWAVGIKMAARKKRAESLPKVGWQQ